MSHLSETAETTSESSDDTFSKKFRIPSKLGNSIEGKNGN